MTESATSAAAPGPVGTDAHGISRTWSSGWKRYVFPSVWLIYLAQTADGVHDHSSGALAVLGYAVIVAFAACYLLALPISWTERPPTFWVLYAACGVLTAIECIPAQDDAFVFLVYVAVLTIASRARWAWPAIFGYAAVGIAVPVAVPAWHAGPEWSTGLTVLLVAFAMWGFFHIIESNRALTAARAEIARLAAEGERSRIARDLHDLLGHSLTTITVKAGLARRLGEHGEQERALAEIAEVEVLSRRTLGDVRAAVSAQHEVNLAGEIATAREVLRASGIIAELPPSVAEVDSRHTELFGWIVREGVTNVVRHSRAEHVRITLERSAIDIVDDGRGSTGGPGNGLTGLRERVTAAGGSLHVDGSAAGFRLRAEIPCAAATGAAAPVEAALDDSRTTSPSAP